MKLLFIGGGQMGSALMRGMVKSGMVSGKDISLFEVMKPQAEALAKEIGLSLVDSAKSGAASADLVFLCTKPAQVAPILTEIRSALTAEKTLISIAAGVTLAKMAAAAGDVPTVRVMPNTPALVSQGMSVLSFSERVDASKRDLVQKLFSAIGKVAVVAEKDMNAVTGLSGSGPAYVFVMIEALADAGVRQGLTRETALLLAAQTVRGSAELVLSTGQHPAVLKDQVTSPGGTTIAGLEKLEALGFRSSLIQAVAAAAKRSEELGG